MNQIDLNGHVDQQAVAALITLSAPLLVFILFHKYFVMGASNTSGGKE